MILESLRARGLSTALREEITVDVAALGPGLIALVGENGSGKTHLLELAGPAVLFREFPSYGESFAAHVAPGVRDGFAELIFVLGHQRYRALVQADPLFGGGRGKTEAYLYRAAPGPIDGWEPVAGPLVRDYADAIEKLVPSRELFLASVFACQGGAGSFFAMPKAARKDLFAAMLGCAHLQAKATRAAGRATVALGQLDAAHRDLAAARAHAAHAEELKGTRATLSDRYEEAQERVECAASVLENARATVGAAREAFARVAAQQDAAATLHASLRRRLEEARATRSSIERRLTTILDVLREAPAIRRATETVASETVMVEKLRAHEQGLRDQLAHRKSQYAALSERHRATRAAVASLKSRRAALALVDVGIPMCGKCPLTADARAAEDEWHALREAEPVQAADVQKIAAEIGDGEQQLSVAIAAVRNATAEIERARLLAARLLTLQDAERQELPCRHELEAAARTVADVTLDLAQAPAPVDVEGARTVVDMHEAAVTAAETQLARHIEARDALQVSIAGIEGELKVIGRAIAGVPALEAEVTRLEQKASDWRVLTQALGRDGIQALEVDAAGPGITVIANDLLAACYGTRFQLALETTAQKKDGGHKEVFDVRIIDAEAGRDATQGSGGEMVILDEALRLALAIFNAQRSGFECRTLYRDETVGALSPANADRYVAMLRKALALGHFHQCLFIAHQPEVWEQADARLFLAGGRIQTDHEEEVAA